MAHDALTRTAPALPPPRSCRIDDSLVREIAAEADVDGRSVVRRLAGLPVRGRVGKRIEVALERRGLLPNSGGR